MFCGLPGTSRGAPQAPVAASASTACASSVTASAVGARERRAQNAEAEHLRRLRLPQPRARPRCAARGAPAPDLRASACRRRESRAGLRPRRARGRRRAAAARRPERRAAPHRERESSRRRAHRGASAASALATVSRARRAAAAQRLDPLPRRELRLEDPVVRRQRDEDLGARKRLGQAVQRAGDDRLAAEIAHTVSASVRRSASRLRPPGSARPSGRTRSPRAPSAPCRAAHHPITRAIRSSSSGRKPCRS